MTTMTLSHSTMDMLAQCARRYQMVKVRGVRQAPAPALLTGTAIHAAIEADNRGVLNDAHRMPLGDLHAFALDALYTECAHNDPDGLLDPKTMFSQVQATLSAYHAYVAPHLRPVAVEGAFTIPVAAGLDFTGRIDLVTERDGVRTIIDFKSAARPWHPGAEHEKTQATAYLMAAEAMQRPADRVTFITFPMRPDGSAAVDIRTTNRSADQRMAYRMGVVEAAARIGFMRQHDWYPASPSPLCAWCGVLGTCGVGQDWLKTHGREPAVPVLAEAEVTV